jgi:Ammonia permease
MRRVASIIPLLLSSLAFAEGQSPKLDTGDTAWMLIAVILMVAKALTGLRVSLEEEIAGLDSSQHREKAYNL